MLRLGVERAHEDRRQEEMAWLQICEPNGEGQGKYTFEILDGKNHQRSLDLSGQGKIIILWPLVVGTR